MLMSAPNLDKALDIFLFILRPQTHSKRAGWCSAENPMACKTRLRFTFPLEQAEPAETENPAKSICITWVSPRQPSEIM